MKKWILNSILITLLTTATVVNVPVEVSNVQIQQTNSHSNERSSFDLMGAEATYDKSFSDKAGSIPEEGIKIKLYVDGIAANPTYELWKGANLVKTNSLPPANDGVIELDTTSELEFDTEYTVKVKYDTDKVQTVLVVTTPSPQVFQLNGNGYTLTSDSIKVKYTWVQANEFAYQNTKLKFEIIDGEDGTTVVNEKENIATDGNYGEGEYEYAGLTPEHNYVINAYSNNNKDQTYFLQETWNFKTKAIEDTFSSFIEFNKASFNSISGVYSWKLNEGIEATNVNLSIYNVSRGAELVSKPIDIKTSGIVEGYEEFQFDNLLYGEKYKVVETIDNNIGEQSVNIYNVETLKKSIPVETKFNVTNTKEAFEGTYTWFNNLDDEQYIQVEETKLEVINTKSGDIEEFEGIQNASLEGQTNIKLDSAIEGETYSVWETTTYVKQQEEADTKKKIWEGEITFNDATVRSVKTEPQGTSFILNVDIDDASIFEADDQVKLKITFTKDDEPFEVYVNGKTTDKLEFNYDDLNDLNIYTHDDKINFRTKVTGLPWDGTPVTVTASVGESSISEKVRFDNSNTYSINPNSLVMVQSKERGSLGIDYKIKLDDNGKNRDLHNGVAISDVDSIQESDEVTVLSELNAKKSFGSDYEDGMLYINANMPTASSSNINFMLNRYIGIEPTNIRKPMDNYNLFYVSSFPPEPFPLWTLWLIIPSSIIPIIALILFVLWYTSKKRWAKIVEKENQRIKEELKNQYNNFGWSYKFDEYVELSKKNSRQLNKYAEELGLELPEGMTKQEKIDMLSLLNDVELKRVKSFVEYEMKITEEEVSKLERAYVEDKSKPLWMRIRLSYHLKKLDREEKEAQEAQEAQGAQEVQEVQEVQEEQEEQKPQKEQKDDSEGGGDNE